MSLFAPSRRKLFELLIMGVFSGIFWFFYPAFEGVILFIFGFIWNWSASIEMNPLYENRRYRFSMLSTVRNTQKLFLKPFAGAPSIIKTLIKILPAGIFWSMVIIINESNMPWWAPFIGSAAFELLQLEINFVKGHKEKV